jgi:hypothetical protein
MATYGSRSGSDPDRQALDADSEEKKSGKMMPVRKDPDIYDT